MTMSTGKLSMKQRNANMDLLRIVSMLLIIFLHSIDHSGVLEAAVPGTWMYYYVYFGYYLAQVCVNCFVLLTGYFMIESKFRPSKLISLWMEVVFYSLIIRIMFFITGQKTFSIVSLISCFVPVMTGRYWFITIYFGLYLLSPFLNIAIKAMTKRQFTALNVVLFLLFSVWNSLHPSIAGMNSGGGWGLAWFVVLYCAAAWFRFYRANDNKCKRGGILVFTAIPVCMTLLLGIANTLNIGIAQTIIHHWYSYNAVPAYLMSLGLMDFFIHINVKNSLISKAITKIAPLTLGVYLIHAHADLSPWMWETLNMPQFMEHWNFPLVQIGVMVGVFMVCIGLDWIRKSLFRIIRLSRINRTVDAWLANIIGIEI